jgi:hypothetical protein
VIDNIVLIDKPREIWKWHSHMVSNDISYLHRFAEELGLGRHKFSNKRGKNQPHYDVPMHLLDLAIEKGAKLVSSSDIIKLLKEQYE